jgi:hypothetical protein
MEPKFKTSFIPKQSLQTQEEVRFVPKKQSAPVGLLTTLTFLVLVASLGASVGFFLYKQHLVSSIEKKRADIIQQREAFEPALVKEYTRVAARLDAARKILDEHDAMTFAFALLEQITLKKVEYSTMTINYNKTAGTVSLILTGSARNYKVLALQSDVFGSNQFMQEPTVNGLKAQEGGTVDFTLSAKLDPRLISYKIGFEQGAYSNNAGGAQTAPESSVEQSTSTL